MYFGNDAWHPLARFASPYTAYRTITVDSGSACAMLQLDKKTSNYMRVYAVLNARRGRPRR